MKPLTEKLKEKFCEFGKHEIHKKITFIFSLRSPLGTHDNFYIHNYKDDLLRKYKSDKDYDDDEQKEIRSMFLTENRNIFPPFVDLSENVKRRFLNTIDKDKSIEDYILDAGREEIKIV